MNAANFDILGVIGFFILLFSGIKVVNSKDKKVKKYGWIVIIISLMGMIIGGYIVLTNFMF